MYFFSRNLAGLKRFTIGLMYLATFTLLQPKVKGSFLATAEYDVSNSYPVTHLRNCSACLFVQVVF